MEWMYSLQAWLETSGLYNDFLSKMPVPLNNVYFDTLALLILIVYAGYRIFEFFKLDIANQKIKRRQAALREESVANEMDLIKRERTARAESAEVSQLMTLAKMQMLNNIGCNLKPAGDAPQAQNSDLQAAMGVMLAKELSQSQEPDVAVNEAAQAAKPARPVEDVDDAEKKHTIGSAIDKIKSTKLPRFRRGDDTEDDEETETSDVEDDIVENIVAEGLKELDIAPVAMPKPASVANPAAGKGEDVFLSVEDIELPERNIEEIVVDDAPGETEEPEASPGNEDYSDVQPVERENIPQANNDFEALMSRMIANKNLDKELSERDRKISEQVDKNKQKLNQNGVMA